MYIGLELKLPTMKNYLTVTLIAKSHFHASARLEDPDMANSRICLGHEVQQTRAMCLPFLTSASLDNAY